MSFITSEVIADSCNFYQFSFCEVCFDKEIITWYSKGFTPKRNNLIRRIMNSSDWSEFGNGSLVNFVNKEASKY
tara:strand:+ start:383 stop:604 length:222 start_codon:yes stop_codon:yes gene_type:complete